MLFKPRKTKLAQNQSDFDAQAKAFLTASNIEVTPDTLALFAAAIQQSDQGEDSFEPKSTAKRIRKAIATRLAYYLIHPDKRPKEGVVAAGEYANETKD